MKLIRSRSFSGLLGGYPGIYQGPRSIFEEAKDNEGEESMEKENSDEKKVADVLADAPEALKPPNLGTYNKTLFSQAETNFLKIMEKMTQLIG
ncbi:hypothetical protein O181_039323 [Austropuccinia psidii MF-1]|uniref:Uncharacterized protein n=1 Tax=Austropuccinia psidii MF-1 TaxID=1389203 RepID=A0A9Q3DD71_9BASI|nr:hypothetical protein [Austropuccinia psidii MF-1]